MSDLVSRIEGMSPKRLALLALELDDQLQALRDERAEPVAIVGIGCRMPGGATDPDGFWQFLDRGGDGIVEVPPDRWDIGAYFDADPDAPGRMDSRWGGFLPRVDLFDAPLFGISRREALTMDPQQRIALEVAWEALEHAGWSPHALSGSSTGVFLGIATNDYHAMLLARGQQDIDTYFATGCAHSVAAGRIAYVLGLQGPNLPVDTACSSSLVAVHLACQALRAKECRAALAGGVNTILSPEVSIALSKGHMMAPDGRCKAFDARADGFVRGEGCGIVVLKRLSDAVADRDRVLAVIRGSALNQDGRSSGITAPNGAAQEAVIRQALESARVEPSAIDYVETHGTGTVLGDPIEAHALAAVFGADRVAERPLVIGSVKTNIGHLEAAAGVAGLIKVVLSLQHGRIPPHLHFTGMNPHIDWRGLPVEVPVAGRRWEGGERPRLAGVSSFGFSGTNAHIIVGEAPVTGPAEAAEPERGVYVLALSGRSAAALDAQTERFAAHVRDMDPSALGDACFTANAGRTHFAERAAWVAESREDLVAKLAAGTPFARGRGDRAPEVAFLFTGQGAQYAGMGQGLYRTEPAFREAIDACHELFASTGGPGLRDLLWGDATDRLDDTRFTQPAVFALQYALARLWNSWGVMPSYVLGHSVGEYAALSASGACSLADGFRLIAERGRLTGGLPRGEGAMAAILAPAADVAAAVAAAGPGVVIAAKNGPESVVISGRRAEVEAVCSTFAARGLRVEPLRVSHAFHSPMMAPVEEEFARVAGSIVFHEPRAVFVSTVTGGPVTAAELSDTRHWRRQLREAVLFEGAIDVLRDRGCELFIEIGPGSTVLGMGQDVIGTDTQLWTPSIRRARPDAVQMAESLAALHVRGVNVDWDAYEAGRGRRRVALPTYPFERQRYWLDAARPSSSFASGAMPAGPMLGRRLPTALPIYEGLADPQAAPWFEGHRVGGVSVLPGAAYVAMALGAGSDALGIELPALAEIDFREALRVSGPGERRALQTVLVPAEDAAGHRVQILGRPDHGNAEWTLHATAVVTDASPAAAGDLASIRARLPDEVAPASLYAALEERGIDLGPGCRNITRIHVGHGEALCEVQVDAGDDAVSGRCDPAVLDACLQALGAAALFGPGGGTGETAVVQSIASFHLFDTLAGPVLAHVRLEGGDGAELRVHAPDGRVLAEALGIRTAPLRLGEAGRAEMPAPVDWFYRLEWQEQALPEPVVTGAVVGDPGLGERLAGRMRELSSAHGLDRYRDLAPEMDRVSAAYVVDAFRALGAGLAAGDVIAPDGLCAAAGIVPRHRRLVDRLLRILTEEGVLAARGGGWEVVRAPDRGTPDAECERLLAAFPRFAAELTLLRRCGPRLADVLRGADPLPLLAPDGSFETLDRLYIDSPGATVFNTAVREAVEAALAQVPRDREVRLLEIGAGTGGTTTFLAAALAQRRATYTYTDISPLFTARAQERFREFPFFRYQALDIEQDPAAQGFAGGQYDVVIAANVLHATADLARTLSHARGLLRPSGLLVLLEGTRPERWVDLTFGMTDGWWRFEDTALRPDYPLISRASWLELLERQGFAAIAAQPSPETQQVVILARAPEAEAGRAWLLVSKDEVLRVALARTAKVDRADSVEAIAPGHGTVIIDARDAAGPGAVVEIAAAMRDVLSRGAGAPTAWLLTGGAQAVSTGAENVSVDSASLWGLARTAAIEHPERWGGVVDVAAGTSADDVAGALVRELAAGSDEDQVAWRGGRRHVPRIVRWSPGQDTPLTVRADGAYVITGGRGALGLKVAAWLVRHGARHLVLAGRTALPPRAEWAALGDGHPAEKTCRAIESLEGEGATVHTVVADVADPAAIEAIRAAIGPLPLRGLVHAAAVFGMEPLVDLTPERLQRVVGPKLDGARHLRSLCGPDLDFAILFSSTTALLGVRGMGAYAAANAGLDAMARAWRAVGIPAVAVNWGTWDELAGTTASDRQAYLKGGLHPMRAERALSALGRVLGSGAPHAVVAHIDWSLLTAMYQARRRRPMLDLVTPSASPADASVRPKATGKQDLVALLASLPAADQADRMLALVREEAGAVLGLAPGEVDVDLGLFESGMDSLMSLELKRRLQSRTGKTLPSTLTFNYPNVRALAGYLLQLLVPRAAAPPPPAPEPAAAPVPDGREDLSVDELASLLAKTLEIGG